MEKKKKKKFVRYLLLSTLCSIFCLFVILSFDTVFRNFVLRPTRNWMLPVRKIFRIWEHMTKAELLRSWIFGKDVWFLFCFFCFLYCSSEFVLGFNGGKHHKNQCLNYMHVWHVLHRWRRNTKRKNTATNNSTRKSKM